MQVQVFGFIPPIAGVDDEFNTFRLGHTMLKRVAPGDEVFLMDEKTKIVFGRARVESVEGGTLGEQCLLHADKNHREVGSDAPETAPERLFAYMQKIYGPHIAKHNKRSCVIYLKRLE
ncbi:hypothetical protein [Massilia sp. TN1-12]|uniref:hypothetical protein n=1 Tax=Massilia paldalensis TaxID=3377675 RepID=UPI00384E6C1D